MRSDSARLVACAVPFPPVTALPSLHALAMALIVRASHSLFSLLLDCSPAPAPVRSMQLHLPLLQLLLPAHPALHLFLLQLLLTRQRNCIPSTHANSFQHSADSFMTSDG
jgi:hypothetical protein